MMGRRPWTALALACCATVAEGAGIVLLVPLLRLAGLDVAQGQLGRIDAAAAAAFRAIGAPPTLLSVLTAYALVVGARAMLEWWSRVTCLELQERFLLRMRTRLYRAIVEAEWSFLCRQRGGELTHGLTSKLEHLGGATGHAFSLVTHSLVGSVYLAFALHISPALTLVTLGCGVALLALLRGSTREARRVGQRLSDLTDDMFAAAAEHVGAVKTTKSYSAETRSAAAFAALSGDVAAMNIRAGQLHAASRALFEIGATVALCVVLFVSIASLHLGAASILLLLFLFTRLTPRLGAIQGAYQSFGLTLPAFADVVSLVERSEAHRERARRGRDRVELRRAIRLQGVTVSYDGRPAVAELSLLIPAGQTVALVGASGAGKSTAADVIMGLLSPERGQIALDGQPLTPDGVAAWRERIGYVAQDTFLFHDSVRANLLWARPDASEADLWDALAAAAADRFVRRLPHGLDTAVGDRGVCLSGGERQRLALARALLRSPTLLILDEATSAVDGASEVAIQRALAALHERVTILLISHRLATVRTADLIYVMAEGQVVEAGGWDELVARDGHFAALYRAQHITPVQSPALASALS
jgi:ATP-binding cassette subfamily C protein